MRNEMQLSVTDGIAIQTEQLNDWKLLLNRQAFKILRAEVIKNNDKAKTGYDICRGTEMYNIIHNVALQAIKINRNLRKK